MAYVLALRADLTWLWVLLGFLLITSYAAYCVAAARVIRRGRALRRRAAVLRHLWDAQTGIGADAAGAVR